jgi:outer membrane immunogenic protein
MADAVDLAVVHHPAPRHGFGGTADRGMPAERRDESRLGRLLRYKMKKLFLGTVALTVLATAASAADMAPRYTKAPAMAEPIYNWTGFYVGLNAGVLSAESNFNVLANGLPPLNLLDERRFISERQRKTGWLAGGQIGYNYQTGISVFGIEADGQWTSNKFTADSLFNDPFFHGKGRSQYQANMDWLVTVRGRAGVAATPSLLVYVTGGVAIAGVNIKYINSNGAFAPSPLVNTVSTTDTRVGWTAGFGAEYALGGGWSVKGEYLRVNFDDFKLDVVAPAQAMQGSVKVSQDIDIIRAGVNYRFGSPVVARY